MLAYVDASVWIARIEGESAYRRSIETRLDQLKNEGWLFCISQAVMMEIHFKPYRNNNHALITTYREIFIKPMILSNYRELFDDGLRIMQAENLKTVDSFHAAIAAHYGCRLFVTTDADYRHLQIIPVHWIDLSLAS